MSKHVSYFFVFHHFWYVWRILARDHGIRTTTDTCPIHVDDTSLWHVESGLRWLLPRGQFWQYHTDMIQWNEWIGVVLHMRVHSVVATEDCTEHSWLLCIWMRNDPRKLSWSSLFIDIQWVQVCAIHPSKLCGKFWTTRFGSSMIFPFPPSVPFCAILMGQEQQLTGTRRGRLLSYQGLEHWNGYGPYGPKWSTLQNGWFSSSV